MEIVKLKGENNGQWRFHLTEIMVAYEKVSLDIGASVGGCYSSKEISPTVMGGFLREYTLIIFTGVYEYFHDSS